MPKSPDARNAANRYLMILRNIAIIAERADFILLKEGLFGFMTILCGNPLAISSLIIVVKMRIIISSA